MSKKIKGFAFDSKASVEDVKARLKHQSLMQDYEELQKEVNVMRNRLETAKKKKLVLAAEVRFLRRRHRCLQHSAQEQPHVHESTSLHQTKSTKKIPVIRKEAAKKRSLPSGSFTNPKKQRKAIQQVTPYVGVSPEMNRVHKRPVNGAKESNRHSFTQSYIPISNLNHVESRLNPLDLNQKQRTTSGAKGATLRNPVVSFDLNQDSTREPSSLKAPIIDLNEVSTGDEEFYGNVDANKFELESAKRVLKGLNDEQHNDLKLSSICRNNGEGSSRVGKRKISWQDPVALRV